MLKSKNDIIEWLKLYNIENYELLLTPNYTYVVNVYGDVFLGSKKLKNIPIKFGVVDGIFDVSYNDLEDLSFCPEFVKYLNCSYNKIKNINLLPHLCAYIDLRHNDIQNIKTSYFYCINLFLEGNNNLQGIHINQYNKEFISYKLFQNKLKQWKYNVSEQNNFNIICIDKDTLKKITKDDIYSENYSDANEYFYFLDDFIYFLQKYYKESFYLEKKEELNLEEYESRTKDLNKFEKIIINQLNDKILYKNQVYLICSLIELKENIKYKLLKDRFYHLILEKLNNINNFNLNKVFTFKSSKLNKKIFTYCLSNDFKNKYIKNFEIFNLNIHFFNNRIYSNYMKRRNYMFFNLMNNKFCDYYRVTSHTSTYLMLNYFLLNSLINIKILNIEDLKDLLSFYLAIKINLFNDNNNLFCFNSYKNDFLKIIEEKLFNKIDYSLFREYALIYYSDDIFDEINLKKLGVLNHANKDLNTSLHIYEYQNNYYLNYPLVSSILSTSYRTDLEKLLCVFILFDDIRKINIVNKKDFLDIKNNLIELLKSRTIINNFFQEIENSFLISLNPMNILIKKNEIEELRKILKNLLPNQSKNFFNNQDFLEILFNNEVSLLNNKNPMSKYERDNIILRIHNKVSFSELKKCIFNPQIDITPQQRKKIFNTLAKEINVEMSIKKLL